MNSVVYYPYMRIGDPGLIKRALLMWDRIEVISPYGLSTGYFDNRDLNEACELVSVPHRPTTDEKAAAHDRIVQLVDAGLPKWFRFTQKSLSTYIYKDKFLPETWGYLMHDRFVTRHETRDKFKSSPAFAFVMMAILAECCAGGVKRTVTDERGAYAGLSRYITLACNGVYTKNPKPYEEVLALVPFSSLNVEAIPLKNLIRLRRMESGPRGEDYRAMRRKFLRRVDDYIQDITTHPYTPAELRELRRNFKQELQDDYAMLGRELRLVGRNALLSKEMGAAVIATFSAALQAVFSGPIAVGSIAATRAVGVPAAIHLWDKYRLARREKLQGRITSYVYLAKKGRFEWDVALRP